MENVRAILASAGMTFADIVKFNAYCMSPEAIINCAGIRNRFLDGTRTAMIAVSDLANPASKVVMGLIAARQE